MKKVLSFLKRNVLIHITLGVWLGVMGAVYVIYSNAEVSSGLSAGSVAISKTNMQEVPEATLQSALDYLYGKAALVGQCPEGMICQEVGATVEWATDKTYMGIVYLNPNDLTGECNSTIASQNLNNQSTRTPTEVKTGCMKWYIYGTDTNNDYLAILDHNTTAAVTWNNTSTNGNVVFENSLAYPYITMLTDMVSLGGYGWEVPAKIISGQEVADLVNNSSWSSSSSSQLSLRLGGTSSYSWLYDYTRWCTSYGCNYVDSNTYMNGSGGSTYSDGYWTSTPSGTAGAGLLVWAVYYGGALRSWNIINFDKTIGLRPVITIDKDLIDT